MTATRATSHRSAPWAAARAAALSAALLLGAPMPHAAGESPLLPEIPTSVGGAADLDGEQTADARTVRSSQSARDGRTRARAARSRQAPTLPQLEAGPTIAQRKQAARTERKQRAASTRRAARRLEADRQVALAALWQPDPALLSPRDTDSAQTAAVRARLSALVSRLQAASSDYEEALYAADRSRVDARRARAEEADAEERTALARQRWAEDRAALGAIAADSYRNGSVGQLGLVLGAGQQTDEGALLEGLTLLSQVSSAQVDATVRAAESARRLQQAEAEQRRARARLERAAAFKASRLQASAQARGQVVADVRRAQQLIRESILIDEIAAAVDTDALTEASARTAAELPGGVVFPLPADSGWRDNDNWGSKGGRWKRGHTGDDFSVACGTPVYAAHAGTVTIRTDQGWSGKWLVMVQAAGRDGEDLGQGAGLATWYAHMSGLTTQHLKQVEAGEQIGVVGSLGNSTGCHLHFEVHPLGGSIYEDNVDPVAWLTIARGYPTAQ